MKATLYSHRTTLGTIDMKNIDESMGVVGGILTPGNDYLKHQQVFRNCGGTHNFAIEELGLNVQLENGCYLHPGGGYSIHDMPEFPDEITVHVVGSNYFSIFDTLPVETPPFVQYPWEPISIEAKFAFEEELEKEISLFRRKKQFTHLPYAQYQFQAIARFAPGDDVLFLAVGQENIKFVVIHLTWRRRAEEDPTWPYAQWYGSWEAFRARMKEDAEEYKNEEEE